MVSRSSSSSARRLTAREREQRAVELRRAGQTYDAIAAELGITRSAAFKAVRRVFERLAKEAREDAEAVRALEVERLDVLLAGVWSKASAGDLLAVDRALKIAERRARLLGLDAPVRRELTGKGGEPLKLVDVEKMVFMDAIVDDAPEVDAPDDAAAGGAG